MIINKIRFKRNGVTLLFKNAEPLLLNTDVFNKSGLTVGCELGSVESEELSSMSAFVDAKTKALQLLMRRSHSVSELRLKLIKRDFDKEIINKILNQLVEDRYLDDKQFAFLFAEEKIFKKRNSLNKVLADLLQRGISKSICADIIDKYQSDKIILDNIKILADRKTVFLEHKYSDKIILKKKIFEYLFRKGFEIEHIKSVID